MGHWNKVLKIAILAIIISNSTACHRSIVDIFPSRASGQIKLDPNSSPEFIQGWNDGCEVGMSAGSNTFYKSFYDSNKVDGWMMQGSKDYKTAWNNAFWFCYRHDYFKQKSSIWGSFFSGYR